MTKDEVLALMGTTTEYAREIGPIGRYPVSNPYRTAAAVAKDGELIEVIYYYTDEKAWEFRITDDELTPIVLKGSRVVGWGSAFFNDAVQRYEIRLR